MNRRNHSSIVRNLLAFSLILAVAGLIGSCKAKEKCPAYGKVPVKQNIVRNG